MAHASTISNGGDENPSASSDGGGNTDRLARVSFGSDGLGAEGRDACSFRGFSKGLDIGRIAEASDGALFSRPFDEEYPGFVLGWTSARKIEQSGRNEVYVQPYPGPGAAADLLGRRTARYVARWPRAFLCHRESVGGQAACPR